MSVPSSTFSQALGTVYEQLGSESKYQPGTLGESEVLFGMSDRTDGVRDRTSRRVNDEEEL